MLLDHVFINLSPDFGDYIDVYALSSAASTKRAVFFWTLPRSVLVTSDETSLSVRSFNTASCYLFVDIYPLNILGKNPCSFKLIVSFNKNLNLDNYILKRRELYRGLETYHELLASIDVDDFDLIKRIYEFCKFERFSFDRYARTCVFASIVSNPTVKYIKIKTLCNNLYATITYKYDTACFNNGNYSLTFCISTKDTLDDIPLRYHKHTCCRIEDILPMYVVSTLRANLM